MMFAALFAAIAAQTIMRYVFRDPLTNSLEFATIAFIWLVFWVASCNMSVNDHVRFDIAYNLFPEQVRRLFGIITNLGFAAIFAFCGSRHMGILLFPENPVHRPPWRSAISGRFSPISSSSSCCR